MQRLRSFTKKLALGAALLYGLSSSAPAQEAIKIEAGIGYDAPTQFDVTPFTEKGILEFGDNALQVGFSGPRFDIFSDAYINGLTPNQIVAIIENPTLTGLARLQDLGEALFKEGCALGTCSTIGNTSTYALNHLPIDLSTDLSMTFYTKGENHLRIQRLQEHVDIRTRSSITGTNTSVDKPFTNAFTLDGNIVEDVNLINTLSLAGMYEQPFFARTPFLRVRTAGLGYNLQHQQVGTIHEGINLVSSAETHEFQSPYLTSLITLELDERTRNETLDVIGIPVYAHLYSPNDAFQIFIQAQPFVQGGRIKERYNNTTSVTVAAAPLHDVIFNTNNIFDTDTITNTASRKRFSNITTRADYGGRFAYTIPSSIATLIPYANWFYNHEKTYEVGTFFGVDTRLGGIAGSVNVHYIQNQPLSEEHQNLDLVFIPWSEHEQPSKQWANYLSAQQLNSTRFLFGDVHTDLAQQQLFRTRQAYVRFGADTTNNFSASIGYTPVHTELTGSYQDPRIGITLKTFIPLGPIVELTYSTAPPSNKISQQKFTASVTTELP